jgi:hypothetical protein
MTDDTVGFGDIVEFPIGSGNRALVVDIDPVACTPPPCLMLAWRVIGNKVLEGVVQTQHVKRLVRGSRQCR